MCVHINFNRDNTGNSTVVRATFVLWLSCNTVLGRSRLGPAPIPISTFQKVSILLDLLKGLHTPAIIKWMSKKNSPKNLKGRPESSSFSSMIITDVRGGSKNDDDYHNFFPTRKVPLVALRQKGITVFVIYCPFWQLSDCCLCVIEQLYNFIFLCL